jgi:hypothetical protein
MRATCRFDNRACRAQKTFHIANDLCAAVSDADAAVEITA